MPFWRASMMASSVILDRASGAVSIPEEGQLVSVRDRHWIIKSVIPSALPIDVMAAETGRQHLIQLVSVEDDGLGDELTVIWEIEPGTLVLETANLPTPIAGKFDDPLRLKTFLDAVRWGAVASADSDALQAPFRSGITIEDYQLDPVVRALAMARANLLIADDVGLGKTIEAGLVVQEMILRHRARSVLVLCPPSLSLKWQQEMRDKFGLEFRIVDAEAVRLLRRERGVKANIFAHFPRLIVSFDWLKMERPMRILREHLPAERHAYPRKIDLLIVDEVHQCAPAGSKGSGKYATDSQRTELLRYLVPYTEHRLFLSATPHNGYENSFWALLELLDPQRFARDVPPDPTARNSAIVRRMKEDLRALEPREGVPRFPERVIDKIEVEYPEEERRVHAALEAYTTSRRKASSRGTALAADLISLLLKKRLFSSPAAFAHTLDVHIKTLSHGGSSIDADEELREYYDQADADFEDDDELEEATHGALLAATRASNAVTPAQQALLEEMQRWAHAARGRADEKARALIAKLKEWCITSRPNGAQIWNDERVIVFTEYRATQTYLQTLLVAAGLGGDRLRRLYGGMDVKEREQIKAAFQSDPANDPVRILLATDTASEGIDLQRHCRRMIHVEIPFNPNRLEQRNGRIDRHGQPSPQIFIYHFVGSGFERKPGSLEGDLDFLSRAAFKLERIRADLGKAGAVLASQVEQAMLGRPADLAIVDASGSASTTALKAERELRKRVNEMHARLLASKEELGISPEAIKRVVDVGLELGRQPPLEAVQLPPKGKRGEGITAYAVPDLTRSWASAAANLTHPFTGVRLPITFDNDAADGCEDVVLAHLGSRLVTQSMRLLRAEIWARAGEAKIARVTGRLVRDADLAEPVILVDARIVVTGADGYRLHEQIFTAGGRLGGRAGFARLNVGEVKGAAAARGDELMPRHQQDELEQAWPRLRDAVFAAVQARATELRGGVMRLLNDRVEVEITSLNTVMTQLATAIRRELDASEHGRAEQLTIFDAASERERTQVARDIDALRRRLDEIPQEMERDAERLRRRYREPHQTVFPAAVTVLVPRRFHQSGLGIFERSRS
jgi:superfamily II DNA or RNA helicase